MTKYNLIAADLRALAELAVHAETKVFLQAAASQYDEQARVYPPIDCWDPLQSKPPR